MNQQGSSTNSDGEQVRVSTQERVPDNVLLSASVPIFAVDEEGCVIWHNQHVADVLRLKKASELGQYNLLKTMRHRDRSVMRAHLDRVIHEQQPARCELELVLPDSSRQWVRLISHPGVGSENIKCCWSCVENLTQIKRMEKNEAFYQRAAEFAGKAESLKDFSAKIFDLLRILFGVENGYVAMTNAHTGMIDFPFFVDQKDPPPISRPPENGITDYVITMGRLVWLNDARSGDRVTDLGFQILGTPPSDWIGVPLTYRQRIVGMVAIQTYEPGHVFSTKDIGLMLGIGNLFEVFLERLELQESQARLSAAIEQAGETVVITDSNGVIQYANPAMEKISGYSLEEVIGKTPAMFQSGKHNAEFYRDMWAVLSAGKSWHGTFINRRKDGTLYEEDAVISPVFNLEGKAANYVAVKRDISRESTLERQYLNAQKMEAVNKLTSGISHDFRNLLMVIRQNAEFLRGGAESSSTTPSELNEIIRAADLGELLLAQLGVFSGDEDEVNEKTDLNALILSFEPVARRLIGEKFGLQFELAPRLGAIQARKGQVVQALSNLLINAAKAMPDAGSITIRTHIGTVNEKDASTFVEPPPVDKSHYVVVEVQDQGSGIEAGRIPRLFEFSIDSDSDHSGRGLGLPTVLEIMHHHRGYISVRNNLPNGTIFSLYFPVTATEAPKPNILAPPTAPEMARGSGTILLAEDEEGARRVISRMLQDQGYTVIEAENGAMAIRSMLFHQGEIDLLLTDLVMPDFDGRALADQIRGLKPDIKVLYTSGYRHEDLKESGMILPEGSLLKKPFRREELISLVQQAFENP